MRILSLVPGSGGTFYCQNCLRDRTMVRALRRLDHDVVMVPLYLPMYGGDTEVDTAAPIFFGGIGAYLREKLPLLRHAPEGLMRLLDAPALLRWAAKQEGSTRAADLGAMTLSMLNGERGGQAAEIDRLVRWITEQERPEVIHVSNALLLGLAPRLREATGAAIVCSLQDEEPWVEGMGAPFTGLVWDAMRRLSGEVALFLSTSRWYAGRMRERLGLAEERVRVVCPGVDPPAAPAWTVPPDPPTIGYLSRVHPAQGFDALLNAFTELRRDPRFGALRLSATGGVTPADRAYVAAVKKRLQRDGLADAVEINESFSSAPGAEFFAPLSVLSTPAPAGEAFGLQIVEAMIRGIPAVQPRIAAYPEILEQGGGVLYDPSAPGALAEALGELLADPERIQTLGAEAREIALARFSANAAARETIAAYEAARELRP